MMHGTYNVTLTHCNMMHGTYNVKSLRLFLQHDSFTIIKHHTMNMYTGVEIFVFNFDTRDYKISKILYEIFYTVSNGNHDDASFASNNFQIRYL